MSTPRLISLVALGVASAVLAASCSTSTPTSVGKHLKKHHLSAPPSTTTTISNATGTTGVDGNGSSITGDTGTGTNTGQGPGLPGTSDTSGGTSTTVAGGNSAPTTTMAGTGPNSAATTGPAPGSTTAPPQPFVTRTGRVIYRQLAPSIARFRPQASPVGATVVIVGKRLSHATSVAFDGLPATITFNSATRIRAVVPIGATTGPISVVTAGGSVTVSGFVVD